MRHLHCNVKGSVLLLFTTREPRLIMITNGQVESGLDDKHLGLLIENHTLAYLNANLWYQGINNALAVLQAQILKQPTPPLTYYPHPGQQHENAPPGSTNTLGFIAGLRRLSYFPDLLLHDSFYLCVKICSGDDYCQYGLSGFMFVYR